jgi:hypothetical protein
MTVYDIVTEFGPYLAIVSFISIGFGLWTGRKNNPWAALLAASLIVATLARPIYLVLHGGLPSQPTSKVDPPPKPGAPRQPPQEIVAGTGAKERRQGPVTGMVTPSVTPSIGPRLAERWEKARGAQKALDSGKYELALENCPGAESEFRPDPCEDIYREAVGALLERSRLERKHNKLDDAIRDAKVVLRIDPRNQAAQQLLDYEQLLDRRLEGLKQ